MIPSPTGRKFDLNDEINSISEHACTEEKNNLIPFYGTHFIEDFSEM